MAQGLQLVARNHAHIGPALKESRDFGEDAQFRLPEEDLCNFSSFDLWGAGADGRRLPDPSGWPSEF